LAWANNICNILLVECAETTPVLYGMCNILFAALRGGGAGRGGAGRGGAGRGERIEN
jgi:hypothetical protein